MFSMQLPTYYINVQLPVYNTIVFNSFNSFNFLNSPSIKSKI